MWPTGIHTSLEQAKNVAARSGLSRNWYPASTPLSVVTRAGTLDVAPIASRMEFTKTAPSSLTPGQITGAEYLYALREIFLAP